MQTEDDFSPRRYQVRHRTTYTYSDDVTSCYERGFLAPRTTPAQRVLSNEVQVVPEPDLVSTHVDHFGNRSYYLEIRTAHRVLEVEKVSVIEVDREPVDLQALDRWTVSTAAAWARAEADAVLSTDHLLPTALVSLDAEVRSYAATFLPPDRPLGQALQDLVAGIHRDFTYRAGATTVRTTLPELLELRAGVCQDFAHLALGCLRTVGLPARYVSGYLETIPSPGKERLEGADASHAWASVLVPGPEGGSWVDLDPTNDQFADSRYLVTAWGRDFRDVSPLKGVVFTEAASSALEVGVDVVRLDD